MFKVKNRQNPREIPSLLAISLGFVRYLPFFTILTLTPVLLISQPLIVAFLVYNFTLK